MADLPPVPPSDKVEIQSPFEPVEVNFLLHLINFYQPLVAEVLSQAPPADLMGLMAFLTAAIEIQDPVAGVAFDEMRGFFRQIYPVLLEKNREENPQDATPGQNFIIIYPRPSEDIPAISPITDEPRIITPGGSGRIN